MPNAMRDMFASVGSVSSSTTGCLSTWDLAGQPYNQLAILEAAKGNKLATVFYYVQSIAVKYPFPVAATNLEKFFTKISKDT